MTSEDLLGWWGYAYSRRSPGDVVRPVGMIYHLIKGPHTYWFWAWQDSTYNVSVLPLTCAGDVEDYTFRTEGLMARLCPECLYSRIDGGVS